MLLQSLYYYAPCVRKIIHALSRWKVSSIPLHCLLLTVFSYVCLCFDSTLAEWSKELPSSAWVDWKHILAIQSHERSEVCFYFCVSLFFSWTISMSALCHCVPFKALFIGFKYWFLLEFCKLHPTQFFFFFCKTIL